MSLVRTCRRCRARQILPLAWRLRIRFSMRSRRERLPICSVHWRRLSNPTPDSVRRYKGLSLSRHGREDAVLIESHAIGAATVVSGFKA